MNDNSVDEGTLGLREIPAVGTPVAIVEAKEPSLNDRVSQLRSDTVRRISATAETLRTRTRSGIDRGRLQARSTLVESPVKAIALGAAFGLALGLLIRGVVKLSTREDNALHIDHL